MVSVCDLLIEPFHSLPTRFVVQDFEPIKHLTDHALSKIMRCNPSDHPILVTEPSWNTPANRERMAELMFEDFDVPAFYIANTGVLNACADNLIYHPSYLFILNIRFAAGKGSALVIDIGQAMASVTPVVDGFVLRKGACDVLTDQTRPCKTKW